MTRQPAHFIPHGGGPCFFMDWDPPTEWDRHRAFLEALPGTLPERPRALLVISGHWEEPVFTVQHNPAPGLLFDYYGFPPHTYDLTWSAPGDTALAERVEALIAGAGFETARDTARGFDHGVFVPLKVAFPAADIPTVQLSLRADMDAGAHLAMGRALAPLRDEGVLIIGTGNTFHNMAVLMRSMRGGRRGPVEGGDFDAWLGDAVTRPDPAERDRLLAGWEAGPGARHAAPREEHLLPLHVVAGAGGADRGVKTLEDHVMGAVESAFRFG
ncbi:MAG: dioxygenase [Alphaproteobacteria bacterium HGW-Alphaproteobacteria-2]|nr:MAG: dioxygenase [Alphaproteobacteria bacterium HGW-Alphaproteobacteria-2]